MPASEDTWTKAMAEADQWMATIRNLVPLLGEFTRILEQSKIAPPVADALVLGVAQQWGFHLVTHGEN